MTARSSSTPGGTKSKSAGKQTSKSKKAKSRKALAKKTVSKSKTKANKAAKKQAASQPDAHGNGAAPELNGNGATTDDSPRPIEANAKSHSSQSKKAQGGRDEAPQAKAEKPSERSSEGLGFDPTQLAENMMKVAQTSQQLAETLLQEHAEGGAFEPRAADPLNIGSAFSALAVNLAAHPQHLIEAQTRLWQDHMALWQNAVQRSMGEDVESYVQPAKGDKRFRHEDWSENQVFDLIKQSYLVTSRWLQETVAGVEGLDDHTKHKIEFFTKQAIDAFSPSNFFWTNPEVLRTTIDQRGENLVRGLNNILEDLQRGKGQLNITQTDMEHFELGRNVATAPGKVVFQNDILQLLQFEPTTRSVYERPLLIFPPWINKYYILDLREENSFIRWAVDKGYTVFVASWVNPDTRLAKKTFEDYMNEGIFSALDAVEKATGCNEVNTIGYCIGGTLLGSALAYMAAKKDHRIKSATFFAAQLDFAEAGDLKVFIDDEQLKSMERQMEAAGGYLEGANMASTFNMLRSNDLIWSFVVNNYLLGKEPFRFDLLFWNADATRMPKTLHMFYLRKFYQENALAEGTLKIGDEVLDLKRINIPVYMQSSKEDHIAPANSVFRAKQALGGPVRFIVAGSGHIAGVINHPDAHKYQYWTNEDEVGNLDQWWDGSAEHPGSWWPDWDAWLSDRSGEKVPARIPGDRKLEIIEDAPGSYAKIRS